MRFTAAGLAADLGGRLHGPGDGAVDGHVVVDGLAIDSRTLRPGQLFAAVRDVRDGHDFVADAVTAGAPAVLVSRPMPDAVSVVVPDVDRALVRLAGLARRRLPDRVVGITGSVGKTTTKDLLAGALSRTFITAASERSFNNELGVPLTLANAAEDTQAAVVEMGARGHGHIALLCSMARPTVGVVTVVASVHTEMMGGLDQIMVAKRELVEALPRDGVAVLNADDARVRAMSDHTPASVLLFGGGGDVRADAVTVDDDLHASFVLESSWGAVPVRLGVRGGHNVTNALAAAAAALWLGVPPEEVAAGLAVAPTSPWRMELTRTAGGVTVLNDAYNAGPASMAAALRALASLPAQRRIAVLGLMAELGDDAPAEHAAVATLAADLGIEVVAVGCDLYGVPPLADADAASAELGDLAPGTAILVKGSRVAGLERVAARLVGPAR
jgi:UDP-N-acetylmuramoyl-tripeptide--D-alanyl-D-alanine ligase